MKENLSTHFLNELLVVFMHNLIYYIPSEIIIDGVLDQIESEIPDTFFDELNLFDAKKGVCQVSNEDALEINQRLLDKRLQLEENIFKIASKSKDLSPITFEIIIQKYIDQLMFFVFITDWLISNLKKYNKANIHLSLIGAFKNQHEYLKSHLKDCIAYFDDSIDIDKEYSFTPETLVGEYIPEIVSRFNQIEGKTTAENSEEIISKEISVGASKKPILKPKVKKQRPVISDEKIEIMILESVFNVKVAIK